jgi:CDP-glucose 4,6-dehydratase
MESMVMSDSFWTGKRVFLTGHTGFKGGWLGLWLQKRGAVVTGYSLDPTTTPSLYDLTATASSMRSVIADIRDLDRLRNAMLECAPDVVFHLAAQPLVRRSYGDPVETYSTNVMGTVHVLEAIRSCSSVRSAVVVTSDKCYENREWQWGYRENEPMGGYDPYSNSKGCAELVSASYRSSFFNQAHHKEHGVALATARAGNVIGGGDWSGDRLVPDLLRAFGEGRTADIRNPHAVRPWQHVLEPLHGYMMLAEKLFVQGPAWAEAWNFGPNDSDARPVSWIADRLAGIWGDGAAMAYRRAGPPTARGELAEARLLQGPANAGLGPALGPSPQPSRHRRLAACLARWSRLERIHAQSDRAIRKHSP